MHPKDLKAIQANLEAALNQLNQLSPTLSGKPEWELNEKARALIGASYSIVEQESERQLLQGGQS
jgi:hypothetical protein